MLLDIISSKSFKYIKIMHLIMQFKATLDDVLQRDEQARKETIENAYKNTQLSSWYLKKEFPSLHSALYGDVDVPSTYIRNVERARRDATVFVAGKSTLSSSITEMGPHLYGYTQLQAGWKVINSMLVGEKRVETSLHEDIHTSDEYETKVLAKCMLDEIELLPYDKRSTFRHLYGNEKHMDN